MKGRAPRVDDIGRPLVPIPTPTSLWFELMPKREDWVFVALFVVSILSGLAAWLIARHGGL